MYTHVATVPREQKHKKEKKTKDEGGGSGGLSRWEAGDRVPDSPLLSALASLDRPAPASAPQLSRASPLTSASRSCSDGPIRREDALVGSPHMASGGPTGVLAQDVYVPMDRGVGAADAPGEQRGGTGTGAGADR